MKAGTSPPGRPHKKKGGRPGRRLRRWCSAASPAGAGLKGRWTVAQPGGGSTQPPAPPRGAGESEPGPHRRREKREGEPRTVEPRRAGRSAALWSRRRGRGAGGDPLPPHGRALSAEPRGSRRGFQRRGLPRRGFLQPRQGGPGRQPSGVPSPGGWLSVRAAGSPSGGGGVSLLLPVPQACVPVRKRWVRFAPLV